MSAHYPFVVSTSGRICTRHADARVLHTSSLVHLCAYCIMRDTTPRTTYSKNLQADSCSLVKSGVPVSDSETANLKNRIYSRGGFKNWNRLADLCFGLKLFSWEWTFKEDICVRLKMYSYSSKSCKILKHLGVLKMLHIVQYLREKLEKNVNKMACPICKELFSWVF
jgi:hypothetical protein